VTAMDDTEVVAFRRNRQSFDERHWHTVYRSPLFVTLPFSVLALLFANLLWEAVRANVPVPVDGLPWRLSIIDLPTSAQLVAAIGGLILAERSSQEQCDHTSGIPGPRRTVLTNYGTCTFTTADLDMHRSKPCAIEPYLPVTRTALGAGLKLRNLSSCSSPKTSRRQTSTFSGSVVLRPSLRAIPEMVSGWVGSQSER